MWDDWCFFEILKPCCEGKLTWVPLGVARLLSNVISLKILSCFLVCYLVIRASLFFCWSNRKVTCAMCVFFRHSSLLTLRSAITLESASFPGNKTLLKIGGVFFNWTLPENASRLAPPKSFKYENHIEVLRHLDFFRSWGGAVWDS